MIKHTIFNIEKTPKRWLNTAEAGKYLGCKERFLRNLRSTGQLHFYKIGGHVLYDIADLDKLVIKNKVI
jgi:DNA binding domain, excisionase family